MAKISFKCKEKKKKEIVESEREEEECHENQHNVQNQGFCCHEHVKQMKKERNESIRKKKAKVNGPNHCIHCDEDPHVFIQIEMHLTKNDHVIYYDESEYAKDLVAYNSARCKRAFQYSSFVLWKAINYQKPHYACVEDGVRALLPPLNGKFMGYKNN
jgi:hypothetical protein